MSERLTTAHVNYEITSRTRVEYTAIQKKMMENSKKIVLLEIENNELNGESIIYDNQEECSSEIVRKLHDRKIINIMILGLTQCGKTGTMIGIIKNYLNDTTNLIPIENIYIITGLSSCEWVDQTRDRMPKSIQERIFHRDNLTKKFVEDIKTKKNVLIIIDEIHIAAKETQTVYKSFNDAGFYDKKHLLNNDIKIVEFTATPDGTIYDLMNWGAHGEKLKMKPGPGYTGCFELLEKGRVYQYKDLCGYNKKTGIINEELVANNIRELNQHINKYSEPIYIIIRTPNGNKHEIVIENMKKYISKDLHYYSIKYNSRTDGDDDINKILKVKPLKHTYIFIKEKLRCSKTLYKEFLGIVYERHTKNPDDSATTQSLVGRGTGYDDNGKSIYFTNIQSIQRYERLWDSGFEDNNIPWNSKTTKYKNNRLYSTGTYNNPSLIDGMSVSSEESNDCDDEPIIKKCKTQDEVKEYYIREMKPIFGGHGPMKRKPNEHGYYTTNIGNSVDRIRPRTTDEIYEVRKFWLKTQKTPYRMYPCYENINDKSTLQFWIIYKPIINNATQT